MNFAAGILTTVSLLVAVVAASTANAPLVRDIDPNEPAFTLAANVGTLQVQEGARDKKTTFASAGESLTPALLEQLRREKVLRVRVKENGRALYLWHEWGWFAVAILGFVTSTFLSRAARANQMRALEASAAEGAEVRTPHGSLQAAAAALALIEEEITEVPTTEWVIERLDELQRTHLTEFLDQLPTLSQQVGVGRYAQIMDRFAAGERQLHRAWSAAADGYLEESIDCLKLGRARIDESLTRFG